MSVDFRFKFYSSGYSGRSSNVLRVDHFKENDKLFIVMQRKKLYCCTEHLVLRQISE